MDKPATDMLGFVIMAFALVVSVTATVGLVYANIESAQQLGVAQRFVSEAPPSGTLHGRNLLDGSEWAPLQDDQSNVDVVLFAVGAPDQVGDVAFWRDIASRASSAMPKTQFVGLCVADEPCAIQAGAGQVLTLLSAMDPVQMHAMAMAAEQKVALVYRDAKVRAVPIKDDRQSLVTEIIGADQDSKAGGA